MISGNLTETPLRRRQWGLRSIVVIVIIAMLIRAALCVALILCNLTALD